MIMRYICTVCMRWVDELCLYNMVCQDCLAEVLKNKRVTSKIKLKGSMYEKTDTTDRS